MSRRCGRSSGPRDRWWCPTRSSCPGTTSGPFPGPRCGTARRASSPTLGSTRRCCCARTAGGTEASTVLGARAVDRRVDDPGDQHVAGGQWSEAELPEPVPLAPPLPGDRGAGVDDVAIMHESVMLDDGLD